MGVGLQRLSSNANATVITSAAFPRALSPRQHFCAAAGNSRGGFLSQPRRQKRGEPQVLNLRIAVSAVSRVMLSRFKFDAAQHTPWSTEP
jgi:hypothetical protein